ncbi:MAG: GntR family transcriptional regulator [Ruminococcus sp.]|nr:GntR family transcriptional regulator [Ruminococcus sp.]
MITIDITGRSPIYEQICRGICGDIAKGILKENDRIPAARALAKELGLNPNTVAKAYGILERDGIIYSVAGKGCFVAKHEGKADKRLTEEFEQKAVDALKAGVSEQTLIDIVKASAEKVKGENG